MSELPIESSQLIITDRGRIYHLNLLPEEIADTVFLVGDPDRVGFMADFLDTIEVREAHREFKTITGRYRGKRISIVSTGIGTDNIDIVLNELDALVNVDLVTRKRRSQRRRLSLIRLGTCGALHGSVELGDFVYSDYALGLDNLIYYYEGYERVVKRDLQAELLEKMAWDIAEVRPYLVQADSSIATRFAGHTLLHGITLTAPGFYAPQARALSLGSRMAPILNRLLPMQVQGLSVLNFEMETSALYGLAALLGHRAATICVAVANRVKGSFVEDTQKEIARLVEMAFTAIH